MTAIEIVEVGPRDGLQNEKTLLSVDQKLTFITKLIDAGVRRLEAGSFVNPKLVPAMAESPEVFEALDRTRGATFIGLALNEKGYGRARDAGADEINMVLVASEGFGRRNQGQSPEETLASFQNVAARAKAEGAFLSATISVAFGCPFDGEVDPGLVTSLVERAAVAGANEIALADTIGVADPWSVSRAFRAARAVAGNAKLRAHFHDTRGAALANVFAAVEAGVHVIDASCGGIGGCPFAPRATGNVATEDVVYMLERAGYKTGLDLDALIRTAEWVEEALGRTIPGRVMRAGGFP
jgi:hydroxymethylglutaryl-CoA lyase